MEEGDRFLVHSGPSRFFREHLVCLALQELDMFMAWLQLQQMHCSRQDHASFAAVAVAVAVAAVAVAAAAAGWAASSR
jgi:hypothetical protein